MQAPRQPGSGAGVDLDATDELPGLTGYVPPSEGEGDGAGSGWDDTLESIAASQSVEPPAAARAEPGPEAGGDPRRRAPTVDSASLADSVREVERWVADQRARAESIERELVRLRESEAAAALRAGTLTAELTATRELLAAVQRRADDLNATLAGYLTTIESERGRNVELAAGAQRSQGEAAALAKTLATRDGELAEALRTLGERAATLTRTEQELAAARTAAETAAEALRTQTARAQALESELADARAELAGAREAIARLETASSRALVRADSSGAALAGLELELARERERASALLERLQTREFARGAYETHLHEREAELDAARGRVLALETERERAVSELSGDRDRTVAELQSDRDRRLAEVQTERDRRLAEFAAERDAQLTELAADRDRRLAELQTERDRRVSALEADLARVGTELREERDRSVGALERERDALREELASQTQTLGSQLALLREERVKLETGLASAETSLVTERTLREALGERVATLQGDHSGHAARIAELEALVATASRSSAANAEAAERALARAMAAEATADERRRAIGSLEARVAELDAQLCDLDTPRRTAEEELTRVRAELQAQSERLAAQAAAQREMQVSLERARGALEEREMQVRRLERSAATSAYALGRIKTSIEQIGGTPPGAALPPAAPVARPPAQSARTESPEPPAAALADAAASSDTASVARVPTAASLTPIDGSMAPVVLGRTTRIGRAIDNELCIESSSVSRHHAVIVAGTRSVYIEDLKSTNGVRVNGRRVLRQKLIDGDRVSVGEVEFVYRRPGGGGF